MLDKSPPKYGGFFKAKMPNIISFLKEVKEELNKVVWPTREQTIRYTILVVVVALAVGVFLGGLDYLLTLLTSFLLQRG